MKVILEFEFEDGELEDFEESTGGSLYDWIFAEMCQNQGFGFLTNIKREESE
jgi:hypothetical protein